MKITILAASVMLIHSTAALADDWRIATLGDDHRAIFFIDRDTVKRTVDTVRFWQDARSHSKGTDYIFRSMALYEASCSEMTYKTLTATFYKDDIYNSKAGAGQLEYAVPSTNLSHTIDAVCSDKYEVAGTGQECDAVTKLWLVSRTK